MNKMLLVGFVCLSLGAFAQQAQTSKEPAPAAPRDQASGMASGKRMHKPVTLRDQASGQASGKINGGKTASDDWEAPTAQVKNPSNGSSSDTSAMATGKRQHQPLTVHKEIDKASVKLVTKQPDASSPKTVRINKEVDASSPK